MQCARLMGATSMAEVEDIFCRFRVWRNSRSKEPLPSQKHLGALLQERFVRHRRGGRIWYLDLSVEG